METDRETDEDQEIDRMRPERNRGTIPSKERINVREHLRSAPDFSCHDVFHIEGQYKNQLPTIIDDIATTCEGEGSLVHLDLAPIPSKESIIRTIQRIRDILFPGFFGQQHISSMHLKYYLGNEISQVFNNLSREIMKAYMHDCFVRRRACFHCGDLAQEKTLNFLRQLSSLKRLLDGDVRATYANDPAAKSLYEIVFCYPGVKAITYYRIAHELYALAIPLIPRIVTEYAHSVTGIDIHPGATIGERFFIDHGNSVVIGETTEIGDDVVIYQGVTLGAPKIEQDENGELIRDRKRHPTIGDRVVIYSGSTILGGETEIGDDAVIGGNAWITDSVPPRTKVVYECPQMKFREVAPDEGE